MQARIGVRRLLSGWGRATASGADVVRPVGTGMVQELVSTAPARGVLARGLGRSYGDAAQNAGGRVLDATALAGVRSFDRDTGLLHAESGLSLGEVMRRTVPFGWFPHVTPGTRHVTLGGAVAADIHGKNHHVDGSFAAGVDALGLEAPAGRVEATREHAPAAFWATLGGMGLTGVVTDVRLQLTPIQTSRVVVDTERAADLDDLMARMAAGDDDYRYSVAWIDLLARGASTGRAVLTRADHATVDDLPPAQRATPLEFDPTVVATAPPWVPPGLLNRVTVAAFNELWFRRAPAHREGELQTLSAFFHPLDAVAGWNRLYGSAGFLQYQFVVPFGEEATLRSAVEALAAARLPSFLAVLKRFGPASGGHLSFPLPGWTLALDVPIGPPELAPLLRRLDEQVAAAGGRVYLAKDARLNPDLLPAMYPRLDEWREARRALDPDGLITSDLDRRLRLTRPDPGRTPR